MKKKKKGGKRRDKIEKEKKGKEKGERERGGKRKEEEKNSMGWGKNG